MMLVDEKGKPFSFESEGMSYQLMMGLYGVMVSFSLPFFCTYNGAAVAINQQPISITFDVIMSSEGTLGVQYGTNSVNQIATLHSGNNTITFSPSSSVSSWRLDITTSAGNSNSSQPYSIKITNIRLNYK